MKKQNVPVSEAGFVMIAVMIGLALVAAISLMLGTESALETDLTGRETEALQAEYLAQAALQHAIWQNDGNVCAGDFSLATTALGAHSYSAAVTGGGTTTAYSLAADQDSWIGNDQPTSNKGGDSTLHIKEDQIEQPLYRFDLSSLPPGAQINSALASFYVSGEHPEGPVTVHRITTDWTEADATWESINGNFDKQVLATIPAQPDGDVRVEINLTAQVQAWVNGEPNYGLLLTSSAPGIHAQYVSKEGAASEHPRLEVVVGTASASPVSITATGTLDSGVTRTLSRPIASAYQPTSTAVLQLGADPGEDVLLDSFYSARNYGSANYLQIHDNGTDWQQYPLIRFDLTGLPPGAAVRSARLELSLQGLNAPGTATVHQMMRDWVEGTKAGGGTADGATWYTHDGINAWASAGGDFDASVVAETAIDGSETWVSWEIAPLVERWLAGEPNFGLMIRPDSALKQANFDSQDNSDATLAPRLTIEYACECGTVCMTPQGSGTVLMVVINPTTLVPEDAQKKTLFESWGYTVDVLSESANASAYAAAAATSDVAFISETVNAMGVGTNLAGLSVGVVSQDGAYNADLGIAAGSAWPVGDELNVVDPSHYITSIFSGGALEIYNAQMEGLTASGTAAPGAQQLAEWSGAGTLLVLDEGATTTSGGTAAGRRVMLPIGRDPNTNWNHLNHNGLLMLQRALQWGTGNVAGASAGDVLLVVGNSGSPSSGDLDRQALIESWGYTVTLIDDGDSQANFDAAVAANDVVYIAGSGSSAEVGTKLTAATIGVLSEDIGLVDELGIAEPVFVKEGSKTILVHNNSHYVTSGFALGEIGLWPDSTQVWTVRGALAPGLQLLAETEGSGSYYPTGLAILETGAELYGGGFAAGRRVQVPWSEGSFDINALNADAQTIMRRAIEWGAGSESTPVATSLLFVSGGALVMGPSMEVFVVPTAAEQLRIDLIESWGYEVTLIHESMPAESFGTEVLENEVIYVSGDVSDATLTKKLKDAPLGIVNEQIALHDEFGLSSSMASNDFNNVSVVDTTHSITNGFSTGWLTVTTVNQTLNALTGTLAPGLQNLAEVWISGANYDYGLAVLETNAELHDGGMAAGRRAQLPWGVTGFDFTTLTANGQTIMQRAIEWAANGEAGDGNGGGGGGGPGYVELYEPWSAGSADTWETVSLASYGVPANAVVEVAVMNTWAGAEYWGGVREVGSSLERRLLLHEAEGGGNDVVTMHVQTNGSSEIQHYADHASRVSFILLGYWTGATYVELFEPFKAGANASWQEHNLATYGVGPNQVAEIVMSQTSTSIEWLVGARHSGSSLQRRVSLHEAEGGGVDAVTMQVETDASSIVEVYAEANSVVDFHLLGYWSSPPGTYTETGGVHGQAAASSTWVPADLSTFGIPANSVAQFIMSNEVFNFERELGVRQVGSALDRFIDFQEAEDGGGDTASVHVNVDGSSQIQLYSASGTTDRYFYPIGWWVIN